MNHEEVSVNDATRKTSVQNKTSLNEAFRGLKQLDAGYPKPKRIASGHSIWSCREDRCPRGLIRE